MSLPGSLVSIRECTDAYMDPDLKFDCAMRALRQLEQERGQLQDPQIRAWNFYLSGVVYGQLTYLTLKQRDENYRRAKQMFFRAASEPGATTVKGPSLHYLAYLNLATHDFQGVLDMLERLQDEVPEYPGLRRELWTSSRNFCGWTRRWCVGPYPFEDLTRGTPEFRRARDLQRRNQELEKAAGGEDEHARNLVEIAKIIEAHCTSIDDETHRPCNATLQILKKVQTEFRGTKAAAYAHFRILQQKFIYEYEGDYTHWAHDAKAIYGEFLKEYPDSEQAKEAREEIAKADMILGESEEPPQE